jgi:pyruvate dehydrogenase E2 component (dihydrolipoamide acetyltransferase)
VEAAAYSCPRVWRPAEVCAASAAAARALQTSASVLATDVLVPSMGDSITEGSISSVLKAANDAVDEDEPIIQIETDKVRV